MSLFANTSPDRVSVHVGPPTPDEEMRAQASADWRAWWPLAALHVANIGLWSYVGYKLLNPKRRRT